MKWDIQKKCIIIILFVFCIFNEKFVKIKNVLILIKEKKALLFRKRIIKNIY